MPNQLTINFIPCNPAPAGGYVISYRPVGTVTYYTAPGPITTSPAVFIDDQSGVEDGVDYEGFIQGDCGGGNLGGQVPWTTGDTPACIAVAVVGSPALPDVLVGEPYSYVINLTGSTPFTLIDVIKPAWMTIAVVGSTIQFTGTAPEEAQNDVAVSFTVQNCVEGTPDEVDFADTFDILAACETWTNPGPENATEVGYTDCNGNVHSGETITPGSNICIQPGTLTGPAEGVLELTGPCYFQVTQIDNVGLGNSEPAACGDNSTVYLKTPDFTITPGAALWQDNLCTVPVTALFVRDTGGVLYSVSGGVVGAPTGNSC